MRLVSRLLFKPTMKQGVTDAAEGVAHAEIQFIAVGTPPDENGSADLKYVLAVAEMIATHMESPKIIVDKSTVPVGTADKVSTKVLSVLHSRNKTLECHVVFNPEFLKEGATSILYGCKSLGWNGYTELFKNPDVC